MAISDYLAAGSILGGQGLNTAWQGAGARSSLFDETYMDRTRTKDNNRRKRRKDPAATKKFNERVDKKYGTSTMSTVLKGRSDTLTPGKYFGKSIMAATVGSGVKREMFANSLGLLTRHQMKMAKTGGFLAAQQAWFVPAIAAFGAVSTLTEGGGVRDYVGEWMLPGIGLMAGASTGWNAGLGIGATAAAAGRGSVGAIGKSVGAKAISRTRFGMLALAGSLGAVGAATGIGAGLGLGYLVQEGTESDNAVNQIAEEMQYAKFVSDVDTTQGTMTHRRKTLSKLAKSGLNDRGTLLGNEAQIMAGII